MMDIKRYARGNLREYMNDKKDVFEIYMRLLARSRILIKKNLKKML